MLNAALHFFLLAGVERPRVRAAEITAHSAGNGNAGGVVVTAFRAGKALAGALELAGKYALSLPAACAPETAGEAVAQTVCDMIGQREEAS